MDITVYPYYNDNCKQELHIRKEVAHEVHVEDVKGIEKLVPGNRGNARWCIGWYLGKLGAQAIIPGCATY